MDIDKYTAIPEKINLALVTQELGFLVDQSGKDYEGLADWLYRYYFWRRWKGKEELFHEESVLQRAIAEARMEACQQTNTLTDLTEQSILFQLKLMDKYAWYRFGEAESAIEFIELLYDKAVESDPDGSRRYHLGRLLNIAKAMGNIGIPDAAIFALPTAFAKAKESVPILNSLIKENTEASKEALIDVLQDIANPDITLRGMREKNSARLGKEVYKNNIPVASGQVFILGNTDYIVIEASRRQTIAVQKTLRHIVDLSVGDITTFLANISSKLTPKNWGQVHMKIGTSVDPEGKKHHHIRVTNNGTGLLLPTVERLSQLLATQVLTNTILLEQALDKKNIVTIPIHIVGSGVLEENVSRWLSDLFELQETLSFQEIKEVMDSLYHSVIIPDSLHEYDIVTEFLWYKEKVGIFAHIRRK